MPYICTTITNWITDTVLEPVSKWVTEQQKKCKGKWWNPFCWFVTVLVQITVWVAKEILVPITQVICRFVTWIIDWFVSLFGVTFTIFHCTDIELIKKTESTTNPMEHHYLFRCNCGNCTYHKEIEVVAENDVKAAEIAKEKCTAAC